MQEGAVDQAAVDKPVLEEICDERRRGTGCSISEEGSLCIISEITQSGFSLLFNATRLKALFRTREEDRGAILLANASLAAASEMSMVAAVT